MAESGVLRASDAEREEAITALSEHFAVGRLTLNELEERVARAHQAQTRTQLAALMQDLPSLDHARIPPAREQRASTARPPSVDGALWGTWAATGILCILIWLLTSVFAGQALYFWPVWVIGPWGALMMTGRAGCGLVSSPRIRR